ncbi:GAF domain-containing protein [Clostridium collagenovorans DSM 3089]|uniref:GAF domain-containing protein n=1 Tax=Clostridium collagenovorans DSM 3089 TaxID=1121306 RepID=A0A1M5VUI9_9CLOT|nr:GAF domain-containing protein [Clostridium collagenovorans]SHH78935.1 GAF domain-containing protein [Clostridium collagenovorans DSM 3089]
MFKLNGIEKMTIEQKYRYMNNLLQSQLSSEKDALANLSNASAIINVIFHDINWAGFYFMRNEELVLGPFQGLPACNRIKVGNGVCGSAVANKKIYRVENVHEFPGHIACDCASKSEIVIPIIQNDVVYGVLDIDSPKLSRFTELEEKYLIKFVELLVEYIDFKEISK